MEEKLQELIQNIEQLEKKITTINDIVNKLQFDVYNLHKQDLGSDLKKLKKSTIDSIDEIRKDLKSIKDKLPVFNDEFLI